MTHRLGSNTRNLPVNFLVEEFKLIDCLAFKRGISTGEFIRRKLRAGIALSDPTTAKELARLRRDRLRAAAMLVLFLAHLAFSGSELVRVRSVRVWAMRKRFDEQGEVLA